MTEVAGRKKIKLKFSVWQFVRLMVFMEDVKKSPGSSRDSLVLRQRHEIWRALDAKLTGLGKRDAQAFSELMMEQDVVLEDVSLEELDEFVDTAAGVIKSMRAESNSKQRDEAIAAGLIFELEEMQTMSNGLKRRQKQLRHKTRSR